MAAENNLIIQDDLARARSVDFSLQFAGSITKLMEALGVTRKVAVQEGATLKMLKVVERYVGIRRKQMADGAKLYLCYLDFSGISMGEHNCRAHRILQHRSFHFHATNARKSLIKIIFFRVCKGDGAVYRSGNGEKGLANS